MNGSGDTDESGHDPLDTAIEWFSRYRSGRMSAGERAALDAWIMQSPENAAALRQVEATWTGIEPLRSRPAISELCDDATHRGWNLRRWSGAIAACLAVLLVSGGLWPLRDDQAAPGRGRTVVPRAAVAAVNFDTPVGMRSEIALADGSLVTLDADSAISTRLDEHRRSVRLLRGRALFRVAKDHRRAFVVDTGRASVTAVGTEFTVDLSPASFSVALIEGAVKVTPDRSGQRRRAGMNAITLKAGQRLTEDDDNWRLGRFDSSNALAWTRGQLVFEDAPLVAVAAEVNRYSSRKIIIGDAAVGKKRLSAVLDAGDMPTMVPAVEMLDLARATKRSDGSVVLSSL
mgnify:CR=1 FL=1